MKHKIEQGFTLNSKFYPMRLIPHLQEKKRIKYEFSFKKKIDVRFFLFDFRFDISVVGCWYCHIYDLIACF